MKTKLNTHQRSLMFDSSLYSFSIHISFPFSQMYLSNFDLLTFSGQLSVVIIQKKISDAESL